MKKRLPKIKRSAEALRLGIASYRGEPEYLAEAYSVLCSTLSICHSLQGLSGLPPDLIGLYEEGIARIPPPFQFELRLILSDYVDEEAALQLLLSMAFLELDVWEFSYLENVVDGRVRDGGGPNWLGLREALTGHKSKSQKPVKK